MDSAQGAEGVDALIFEADGGRSAAGGGRLEAVLAGDGAADAAVAELVGFLEEGVAEQPIDGVAGGLLEICGGQGPQVSKSGEALDASGPAVDGDLGPLEALGQDLDSRAQAVGVVEGEAAVAANHDALQVLGTHDGAEAGPAGDAAGAIGDAGEADEVLSGGADGHGLEAASRGFFREGGDGFGDRESPDVTGVADGYGVVIEPQIDGRGGGAGDDEGSETGARQGLPDGPGDGALADETGLRRSGSEGEAVGTGHGCAGESAGGHDQDVGGTERVGAGREKLVEDGGGEGRAADEAIEIATGDGLDAGRAVGQIDAQEPARCGGGGRGMGLEVVSHRRGHLRIASRRYEYL